MRPPVFTFRADDPGAAMILRTWGRGVLYEVRRRYNTNSVQVDDAAAHERAEQALAAADAIEKWRSENPGTSATTARRATPSVIDSLKAWVERNPSDGHAHLVGLLLADFEEIA